ncbi:hypothetical protein [Spiroplasma clarkii]|uniref:Uncharacterized protein n=1 Tax=Spiroplasma clarkii TaxID=2139 RepID=A0A2K8KIJ2_9MOLU|nr:hypothetical protein [Spiroplasma clarkii]ATX71515.1 hypothetical protein SCLAR_v1c12150 [Spiroplasma clarkii]
MKKNLSLPGTTVITSTELNLSILSVLLSINISKTEVLQLKTPRATNASFQASMISGLDYYK